MAAKTFHMPQEKIQTAKLQSQVVNIVTHITE